MDWILIIFEEPKAGIGCGGIIMIALLLFCVNKCDSCSSNSAKDVNIQKVEPCSYQQTNPTSTYKVEPSESGERGAYSGKIRTSKLGKRFDAMNDGTWCPTCGKHYDDGKLHHILDLYCTFEEDIDKEGLNWTRVWCNKCQDYHIRIVN